MAQCTTVLRASLLIYMLLPALLYVCASLIHMSGSLMQNLLAAPLLLLALAS